MTTRTRRATCLISARRRIQSIKSSGSIPFRSELFEKRSFHLDICTTLARTKWSYRISRPALESITSTSRLPSGWRTRTRGKHFRQTRLESPSSSEFMSAATPATDRPARERIECVIVNQTLPPRMLSAAIHHRAGQWLRNSRRTATLPRASLSPAGQLFASRLASSAEWVCKFSPQFPPALKLKNSSRPHQQRPGRRRAPLVSWPMNHHFRPAKSCPAGGQMSGRPEVRRANCQLNSPHADRFWTAPAALASAARGWSRGPVAERRPLCDF